MDILPAKTILADIFPANVTKNGEFLGDSFKVFLTESSFVIFSDGGARPSVYEEVVYDSYSGSRRTELTVVSDDDVYVITHATNCGCGTRLRGFNPYRGARRMPIA